MAEGKWIPSAVFSTLLPANILNPAGSGRTGPTDRTRSFRPDRHRPVLRFLASAGCWPLAGAGMTDLIRPALYQAYHKIENISSDEPVETYDVVGPICESSDVFGKAVDINKAHRGDLIALRSAGAYGEIMASQYNCRQLPKGYITEDF